MPSTSMYFFVLHGCSLRLVVDAQSWGSTVSGRTDQKNRNDTFSTAAYPFFLSTPQLASRQSGSLCQRVELSKGKAGIGEMAQTAIGAGDDVFFADQFGEAHDALGDQLGMFDEVRGVVDHSGEENLSIRQL